MTAERPAAPRLFIVRYTGARKQGPDGRFIRRSASAPVKVPYSGLFAMTETLTRALTTGQIVSYTVRLMRPDEIAQERANLKRWPEALAFTTTEVTSVDFSR